MPQSIYMKKLIYYILLANLCYSCVPPQDEVVLTDITIDIQDSLFQQISTWQDLRQSEDLYSVLYHPNPSYRYLAIRALGNMGDLVNIDTIARLLKDPIAEVRTITAFTLGQTHNKEALPTLLEAFGQNGLLKEYAQTQKAILEAVGKCGEIDMLDSLSIIENYSTSQDTALLEGQALAIFQFGLRGIISPLGTRRMVRLLTKKTQPESVQLLAATYLGRMKIQIDSLSAQSLSKTFEKTTSPQVRMALAIALGKTEQNVALTSLIGQFEKEKDYRVKCNILRALSNFPYEQARPLVIEAIRSPNEHIARRATEYLLDNSSPNDAVLWWRFAKDSLPTPIHLELYRIANRHLPTYRQEFRNAINAELRQRYINSKSPNEQADLIRALSEFAWNFRYIFRESQKQDNPIVKTVAMEALLQISEIEDFDRFFGLGSKRVTLELAQNFTTAIQSGIPGQVAVAAIALRSSKRDFRPFADSIAVYQQALDNLELPAMIESYNELAHTIQYLKGEDDFKPKKPDFNHPIDWKLIKSNGDIPTVEFTINKKKIVMELWPDIAPGTVANFIKLANDGFFKNTQFHRVVPNFVVQGGSPSNEAFGSLDYTIRSEFSPRSYNQEGFLAMASAGPDTEGTQFFITHSPTLHLDGKYTMFGKVITGMDVVHEIQRGDKITNAKMIK